MPIGPSKWVWICRGSPDTHDAVLCVQIQSPVTEKCCHMDQQVLIHVMHCAAKDRHKTAISKAVWTDAWQMLRRLKQPLLSQEGVHILRGLN